MVMDCTDAFLYICLEAQSLSLLLNAVYDH